LKGKIEIVGDIVNYSMWDAQRESPVVKAKGKK
jgi:hypothetical protein